MRALRNVTLVICDTVNYGEALAAIQKTHQHIKTLRTVWFTDIDMEVPDVEIIKIPHIYSKKEYSQWMIKELGKFEFTTSHLLIIQGDGYVLDGEQWDHEFLNFDYIGAPWFETDGYNVGNGGFSLRSVALHKALAEDPLIKGLHPEDSAISRIYRDYLEQTYGFKWAPDELAHKFSFELHEPKSKTFGFHQFHHPAYIEPIVIKRTGALGDVIQVEPVLEYYHNLGHPVYLDTMPGFAQLFGAHYFPVGDYSRMDKAVKHRVINLDMAYEAKPDQLHLKSYFEFCGVKDYKLRNPVLRYPPNSFFPNDKYVREQPYRNVHDVDWIRVVNYLRGKGYAILQIGKGKHEKVAAEFNCANEVILKWLIGHCSIFLGIDSGPAAIAMATQRPSVLFFGSVNPEHIHYDLSKATIIQMKCPINKQHCWSSVSGTTGVPCAVEGAQSKPPCCTYETKYILDVLDEMVYKLEHRLNEQR